MELIAYAVYQVIVYLEQSVVVKRSHFKKLAKRNRPGPIQTPQSPDDLSAISFLIEFKNS